jgi:putative ABC transport system permease protein
LLSRSRAPLQCATRFSVTGQAFVVVLIGLLLGLVLSVGVNQALRTFIFGVTPYDQLTVVVVSSILLAVTALAAFLPARLASQVDPTVAMRAE